jgi:hypothetical protein
MASVKKAVEPKAAKPTTVQATKLETPISRAMKNNPQAALASLAKGKALSRVANASEKAPKAKREHKPTKKEAVIRCFAEGKMTDVAIAKKVGVKPSYISRIRMRANTGKLSEYMTTLVADLKIALPIE